MILTCPECATSYFVDDERVPPGGRTVKCSSCGARWRAMPEGEAQPQDAAPPASAESAVPTLEDEILAAPDEDLEFVPSPITPARRSAAKGKTPVLGRVAIAAVAVVALALGAAAVLRQQLANLVPATAPVFAAVGLPVDTLGLAFEGVVAKPALLAGRPVLSVTGAIHNTRKVAVEAPPIRISLLDKAKQPLVTYELNVQNAKAPPGGRRFFAWNLPQPPAGAEALEIAFDAGARHAAPPAEIHALPAAPAPVEAQSLPPTSPDGLTRHE
jgi:predicted Zn finger-like uncharacterized protein